MTRPRQFARPDEPVRQPQSDPARAGDTHSRQKAYLASWR